MFLESKDVNLIWLFDIMGYLKILDDCYSISIWLVTRITIDFGCLQLINIPNDFVIIMLWFPK